MHDFEDFLKKIGKTDEWELLPEEYDEGKSFWKNTIVRLLVVAALFFWVGEWLVLGNVIFPRELPVILAYNVYFGVSLLGSWQQIFWWPVLGGLLLVVNVSLAWHYYRLKERLASYILLLGGVFVEAGFLIFISALAITNF